jgi:hypothetical protein
VDLNTPHKYSKWNAFPRRLTENDQCEV